MRQLIDSSGDATTLSKRDVIECEKDGEHSIKLSFYRDSHLLGSCENILDGHLFSFLNGVTLASGLNLDQFGTFNESSTITFTLTSKGYEASTYHNLYSNGGQLANLCDGDYYFVNAATNFVFFKRDEKVLDIFIGEQTLGDTVMLEALSVLHAIELTTGLTVFKVQDEIGSSSSSGKMIKENGYIGRPLVRILDIR